MIEQSETDKRFYFNKLNKVVIYDREISMIPLEIKYKKAIIFKSPFR